MMVMDPSRLPDISAYIDLLNRYLVRRVTAPEFKASFLQMMKAERRMLNEPIYLVLQEMFGDADAYVERPDLRTEPEDLDDEQLLACASRARQALRDIGFD